MTIKEAVARVEQSLVPLNCGPEEHATVLAAVLDLCLASIRLAHSRCDDLSCEEAEEWACARLTALLSPENTT